MTQKYTIITTVFRNTFEELLPGRGFFLQHIFEEAKVIDITGDPVIPEDDYYEIKLPSNGDPYTYHMVGNPYWYDIKWKDCMVRVPMTDELPLAKPVALSPEEVEAWHLDINLVSEDGKSRDIYNRVGVVKNADIDLEQSCAYDLLPPGDYIRLSVNDPSDPEREAYSYDYRTANLVEYCWKLELSTTYDEISTILSLDNLESIPDDYTVSLYDCETGKVYDLNETSIFEVELTSDISKTFELTATKKPVNDEENIIPEAVCISDIRPNPFNPSTTISYSLGTAGNVSINVYNLNGQLVDTIFDGYSNAGYHRIVWNAKGRASGVYIVSLVSQGKRDVRKIALMK